MGSTTQGGISDNVAGALCYTPFFIGIICSIVFLVVAPYNRNRLVRFHAFQSLLLHLAFIVLSVVLSILVGILAVMTHGVAMLLYIFHPILWIGSIVLVLVMMYQAYNGQKTKLPIIGDIADKQA